MIFDYMKLQVGIFQMYPLCTQALDTDIVKATIVCLTTYFFLEGSLGVIYELNSARFSVGKKSDIRGIKLGPTSGQKRYSYFTCCLHLQKKHCENKILKLETPIS